jgi:flavin reductase (DIM6/NTAB) family NADH-FMN oxidoreductase RutF
MSEAVEGALAVPSPQPRPAVVDETRFREVMASFVTGVVVVTCVADGADHAMTANSFTSVSLDPPLVLVCVEADSRFHEVLPGAETWAVSILDEHQRGRASWFATRSRPLVGQFDSTPARRGPSSGALLLDGSLATLECRTVAVHRAGDHDIVIGEVLALDLVSPTGRPLVYFGRTFRTLGD